MPLPEQPPPVFATRMLRLATKIVIIFCGVMLVVTLVGMAVQETADP